MGVSKTLFVYMIIYICENHLKKVWVGGSKKLKSYSCSVLVRRKWPSSAGSGESLVYQRPGGGASSSSRAPPSLITTEFSIPHN